MNMNKTNYIDSFTIYNNTSHWILTKQMIKRYNIRSLSTSLNNNPFYTPIPYEYIRSKEKALNINFRIDQLDYNTFNKFVAQTIARDVRYTVYIRVRYNTDTYFMGGNQFGHVYDSDSSMQVLYEVFIHRLNDYFTYYKLFDHDIVYIQLCFRRSNQKLFDDFKKEIDYNKGVITPFIRHENKILNLPISVNQDSLGKPLDIKIDDNMITGITISINGTICNFLDIIIDKAKLLRPNHKDCIVSFDSGFKFYQLRDSIPYVLAVKIIDEHTIHKIKYSMSGVILNNIKDSLDKNIITRKSLNNTMETVFEDQKLIYTKKDMSLKAIPKSRKNSISFISDPNIGVIDTETFTSIDGLQKIYALGFKTNLHSEPVIYYIDKDELDSDKIVLNMINELLRPKYDKTKFYCHNLSGYDIVFILKILTRYNDENTDKYNISGILRDDKIIQLTIHRNKKKVVIRDSYAILPESLYNLGTNFEVDTVKGVFPYKFAKQDNLFYIGNTPNKSFYKDISDQEYKALYRQDWSFKDETVKYLENDLLSLYEIVCKANKQVFNDYDVNLTDNITISGLAVRIFLKDFYKGNIPNISKPSIYNDIKKAYYGGMTEVYKPCGYNLYYYDVNSLYPYVALQDMPGLICSKLQYYTDKSDINNLFGFFYCGIEAPINSYLGLLPVRDISGVKYPVGKWTGWYFSEELKFAKENGYKITVKEGYSFNKQANVFKEYVDKIYNIKSNAINKTQKSMAKSLLNNLLGRFGISLDKAITEIVNEESFDTISQIHKVTSYKIISPQHILVSYVPKLDNEIINSHGLDIIKLLNDYGDKEVNNLNVTSVAISAAVTAYGRIHINRIKLDILLNKANLYYSDTDSIVTDKELNPSMISANEIGKLKLEHKVDKGIFISGKTYWLCNDKGEFINKAKGIKSNSMSYLDYIKLLNDINVTTAVKTESKINWELGHVTISDKMVNINSDSYNKRTKVIVQGKWVDTRPLNIDELAITKLNETRDVNNTKNTTLTCTNNAKQSSFILISIITDKILKYLDVLVSKFHSWNRIDNSDKTRIEKIGKEVAICCLIVLVKFIPDLTIYLMKYNDNLDSMPEFEHYPLYSKYPPLQIEIYDVTIPDDKFKESILSCLNEFLQGKYIEWDNYVYRFKSYKLYDYIGYNSLFNKYNLLLNEFYIKYSIILHELDILHLLKESNTDNMLSDAEFNKSIMRDILENFSRSYLTDKKGIFDRIHPYLHNEFNSNNSLSHVKENKSIMKDIIDKWSRSYLDTNGNTNIIDTTPNRITRLNDLLRVWIPDEAVVQAVSPESVADSPFTPSTYRELKLEILSNERCSEFLKRADIPWLSSHYKEIMLDRYQANLAYLYEQQHNHEKSILSIAKNTRLNDIDMDEVYDGLYSLKKKVSATLEDIGNRPHRRLNIESSSNVNSITSNGLDRISLTFRPGLRLTSTLYKDSAFKILTGH